MFHLFFALCIVMVAATLWFLYALFEVARCRHRAEIIYGRLVVVLRTKNGLLSSLLAATTADDEQVARKLRSLQQLRKQNEAERYLSTRLAMEGKTDTLLREILDSGSVAGTGSEQLAGLAAAAAETASLVSQYNELASRIEKMFQKKMIAGAARLIGLRGLKPFGPA